MHGSPGVLHGLLAAAEPKVPNETQRNLERMPRYHRIETSSNWSYREETGEKGSRAGFLPASPFQKLPGVSRDKTCKGMAANPACWVDWSEKCLGGQ